MQASSRKVLWLLWGSALPSVEALYQVVEAFVISIGQARLTLTRILDSEWKSLEAVVGGIAKRLLGVHYKANALNACAELGWWPLKIKIQVAKLLLFGRLNRERSAKYTVHLVLHRRKQVENGCRKGLFGEIWDLTQSWEAPFLWDQSQVTRKKDWKSIVHDVAEDQVKSSHKQKNALKKSWGKEEYVDRLNPVNRAKLAAVRLSVTNCMGDKLKETVGLCRVCNQPVRESSPHLIFDCQALDAQRTLFRTSHGLNLSHSSLLRSMGRDPSFLNEAESLFKSSTGESLFPFVPSGIELEPSTYLNKIADASKWLASHS